MIIPHLEVGSTAIITLSDYAANPSHRRRKQFAIGHDHVRQITELELTQGTDGQRSSDS